MKKITTVATSMAFVAALSIPAFAQIATDNTDSNIAQAASVATDVDTTSKIKGNDESASAQNASTATNVVTKDTANQDNDLKIKGNDESANAQNGSTATNTAFKDSFNTDNSMDNSVTISDVKIAVSSSDLSGAVTGNIVTVTTSASDITTGNNAIRCSFDNAAGIIPIVQNTGINSQIQQSVNVQSNLTMP